MILAGVNAYAAREHFEPELSGHGKDPIWCAERFGQSVTFLPDGRVVLIGGEHEDFYDPDFCIYNDVWIRHPSGALEILAYPEAVFPPTDFHTATLVEPFIYLIGRLGYGRQPMTETPIFRLHTQTWEMESLRATGPSPGWIYKQRAVLVSPTAIEITDGKIASPDGPQVENSRRFILALDRMEWTTVAYTPSDETRSAPQRRPAAADPRPFHS